MVYIRGIETDFLCECEELLQVSCLYGAAKDMTLLNKLNVLWKHMVDLKMISHFSQKCCLPECIQFIYLFLVVTLFYSLREADDNSHGTYIREDS